MIIALKIASKIYMIFLIIFIKDLPRHMHLDGELFGGRKKFQSTVSIVKTPEHALWNKVSYNVSLYVCLQTSTAGY